jgi:hypothetical protein
MNPVFILSYSTVFAAAYAAAMVWITERKDKTYRQGIKSFSDCFLLGAFWLLLTWGINLAVLFTSPGKAITCNIAMLTFLAGYMLYKETRYKLREAGVKKNMRIEMRVLSHHSANDPANAMYFERASELFEKLGETENAAAAARRAVKLDPTVRNTWRLEQLEDLLKGEGHGHAA